MPLIFRFLVKKNRDQPTDETIEDRFTLEDLATRLVVRDEKNNNFLVFENTREFLAWQEGVPKESRCFHEVVFGKLCQRLKFDIDIRPGLFSCVKEVYVVLNAIIDAILEELRYVYAIDDVNTSRDDLAVTDSSGETAQGWKYSYHIIALPFAVADNEEAKAFTAQVIERLAPEFRDYVDPGVNKSLQMFRLYGSTKPQANRFKIEVAETSRALGTASVPVEKLFIVAPLGAKVLRRITNAAPKKSARIIQDSMVRSAIDLADAEKITVGHEFRGARGSLLCFNRQYPTNCRICKEVHHKDNSLMLGISKEGLVTEYCRQSKLGEKKVVGTVDKEMTIKMPKVIDGILSGDVNPHEPSKFETLPESHKTIYAENTMRDYELVPTLAVLAQMKLGKTKALHRYVNAHFPPGGLVTKVVRIITFRQTFSNSLADIFADFALYTNVVGEIDHVRTPRLIIQTESLPRVRMSESPEPIDLLVLDEVESILAQFNSGLHQNLNAAFAMFSWMLKTAQHVVCMDANLGDRTFNTLARMRPGPVNFHWNRFARASEDTFFFTMNHRAWLDRLREAARAGLKIVLPTNSLIEAKVYEAELTDEFPDKKIALYSSETQPSKKAAHFRDVHQYWRDLDVLIYTPTCSAGVSFELEHYDVLFGFFCDTSCDVETCRQMLGRVRSIRTKEHYICLRATGAALPSTIEEIRRLICDKRAGLHRSPECAFVQYEYDNNGHIRYYESNYFFLWLETMRICNLSHNVFISRFIRQVADTGATIELMESSAEPWGLSESMKKHQLAKRRIKMCHNKAVALAHEMTPEEAAGVREAFMTQQDIPAETKFAYEKYQLREVYSWYRDIDAKFVEAYHGADVKQVYRNLCAISVQPKIGKSLELIRQKEASQYALVPHSVSECRDLMRNYTYQIHLSAVRFLFMCGFKNLRDTALIHSGVLEARLRASIPALKHWIDQLLNEFKIPNPNYDLMENENDRNKFLKGFLRHINAVLRRTYGHHVQKNQKREYYIGKNYVGRLFAWNAPSDRPHVDEKCEISDYQIIPRCDDDELMLFLDREYYGD